MEKDQEKLLHALQIAAREGKKVKQLIEIVKENVAADKFNSFAVMNFFMKAFDLTLAQVRELSGAESLGGGAYTDSEIDNIILPHIIKSCNHQP